MKLATSAYIYLIQVNLYNYIFFIIDIYSSYSLAIWRPPSYKIEGGMRFRVKRCAGS
ncbi:hypothetical protein D9M68_963100 [compost metagenome]